MSVGREMAIHAAMPGMQMSIGMLATMWAAMMVAMMAPAAAPSYLVMAVLFVAGTMSFAWAAAISIYILAERLLPMGRVFDRTVGALCAWGAWLITAPSVA